MARWCGRRWCSQLTLIVDGQNSDADFVNHLKANAVSGELIERMLDVFVVGNNHRSTEQCIVLLYSNFVQQFQTIHCTRYLKHTSNENRIIVLYRIVSYIRIKQLTNRNIGKCTRTVKSKKASNKLITVNMLFYAYMFTALFASFLWVFSLIFVFCVCTFLFCCCNVSHWAAVSAEFQPCRA